MSTNKICSRHCGSWCVFAHACACVCVCIHAHMLKGRGQRHQLGIFLFVFYIIFETGSLSEPGASYPGQTDWQGPGIPLPLSSPVPELQTRASTLNFCASAGVWTQALTLAQEALFYSLNHHLPVFTIFTKYIWLPNYCERLSLYSLQPLHLLLFII